MTETEYADCEEINPHAWQLLYEINVIELRQWSS